MPEINHPNGFSLAIAQDLAGSSALAYEAVIHGQGITVLDVLGLDLRAVVIRYDDHTEIAIRGTKDARNWVLDFDVLKTHLSYGVRVHDGFLQSADALLPLVLAELLPSGHGKALMKPLRITGHSLGGAVASLIALFLQREGLPVEAVYTFASPRVGNAAWRQIYTTELGQRSYRVVAAGDLVPLMPGLLDGYRHVGHEILLTPQGIFARPPHWWEIMQDSCRVINAINRGDAAFIVKYHSIIGTYLKLLTQ